MKIERLCCDGGMYLLVVLILAGCGQPEPEGTPPPPQVSATTITTSRLELTEDLPGRVAAVRVAEIRPQVSGIVQRRLFEQGTEVRAGQPLFQINPAPFRADADTAVATLQRAEAALARAQVQTARLQPLVEADAISRQVYDDAASQRDQAAADVAQARAVLARRQLDLKFATVEAPISGRIDQALVTEGALVNSGDNNPMARVQQIDQVYVDVRRPAASLEALREALETQKASSGNGLPVAVLRSNGEPYAAKGRILFSGVNVDAGTGDVLLRVLVDNPDIGAARAAFFPRLSLTASLGYASPDMSDLFNGGSRVWTFAPQITLPIFQGGKLRAELRLAEVRKSSAVTEYERAIQIAFREVADGLAGRKTYGRQIEAQTRAVASAERRTELSNLRYRAGVDGRLELLDSQRQLYAAQQTLLDLRRNEFGNAVALYKALGGGLTEMDVAPAYEP